MTNSQAVEAALDNKSNRYWQLAADGLTPGLADWQGSESIEISGLNRSIDALQLIEASPYKDRADWAS